jgi:hypothetical protein
LSKVKELLTILRIKRYEVGINEQAITIDEYNSPKVRFVDEIQPSG